MRICGQCGATGCRGVNGWACFYRASARIFRVADYIRCGPIAKPLGAIGIDVRKAPTPWKGGEVYMAPRWAVDLYRAQRVAKVRPRQAALACEGVHALGAHTPFDFAEYDRLCAMLVLRGWDHHHGGWWAPK